MGLDLKPPRNDLPRRRFLKRSTTALIGLSVGGVGLHQYTTRVEIENLELERVSVPIPGLASGLDGFRIAQLSDFHLYPTIRLDYVRRVVERANRLAADLVVLTGDFVQRDAEAIFDLAPVLARLNAPCGVWACLGNHDYWQGVRTVRRGLQQERIPLLVNRGEVLSRNGAEFYLAGVDDGWSGRPDLRRALEGHRDGLPAILLAHEPDLADRFCQDPRIALQLSGHSHGGQVRLPVVGAPFLPRLGRKYDLGLYRIAGSWLYTNRGIGVTTPVRFNCRPELTELTLVRA